MKTPMTSTHHFPTLYGHSTKGQIKVWNIRVEDASGPRGSQANIIITHGQHGGKQQETIRKVTSGKNVGRANATTPWSQAIAEATSKWQAYQDKKGYSTTISAAAQKQTVTRAPMLAMKYEGREHDVVWPAYVQPKLNGVRCLMERRGDEILFHSRGQKQFATLTHLVPDALAVMTDGEILDGELYNHGEITFQELVSLIKNVKTTDPAAVARYIQFWNYDVCSDEPFAIRQSMLREHGHIHRVPTYLVREESEMREYHGEFTQQGYEGTMVRSGGDEPYRFQYRSASLLKVKDFQDAEYRIVAVEEGRGKSEGQATLICETSTGLRFGCRCKGTDAVRQEQWTNRAAYIGKMLTVKYQTLSDDGVPIFPVGITVRDYE